MASDEHDDEMHLMYVESGGTRCNRLIAHHMTGERSAEEYRNEGIDYPIDSADLEDCVNFVSKNPQWRKRIGEMAAYSVRWKALAENWDTLEASVKEGDAEATGDLLNEVMNATIGQHDAAIRTPYIRKRAAELIDQSEGNHCLSQLPAQEAVLLANEIAQQLYDGGYKAYWVSLSNEHESSRVASASYTHPAVLSKRTLDDLSSSKLPAQVMVRFNRDGPELPELPNDFGKSR